MSNKKITFSPYETYAGVRIYASTLPEDNSIDSESVKHDSEKPMLALLPPNALEEIAKVLTFGANKYGMHNWNKTGFSYTRLLSASMRHLTAFCRGEDKDPESGISHLAHAACNLMFLIEQTKNGKGKDDRLNS